MFFFLFQQSSSQNVLSQPLTRHEHSSSITGAQTGHSAANGRYHVVIHYDHYNGFIRCSTTNTRTELTKSCPSGVVGKIAPLMLVFWLLYYWTGWHHTWWCLLLSTLDNLCLHYKVQTRVRVCCCVW